MNKPHYAWAVLAGCCVLTTGMGCLINCLGQYLVSVAGELHVGIGAVSLYVTVQGLTGALAAPLVGRILPRVNIRVFLSLSFAACALSTAAMGLFTQIRHWYLAGAIIGVGCAFCYILPVPIIVGNWFAKRTGLAIGVTMAFAGVGGAIMNPVLAYVIEHVGWRQAYMLNGGAALLLCLPFTMFVISYKPADKGLLPLGAEEAPETTGEMERGVPSLPPGILVSRPFLSMVFVVGFIAFTACFPQQLPAFVSSLGMTASMGGLITSVSMVGNIGGKLSLGYISDRFGASRMGTIGMGVVAVAFLLLFTGRLLLLGGFMLGMAMSMTTVATPLLARALYDPKHYNILLSYLSVSQGLVNALGISVIGFLYDFTGSYRTNFVIGAVLCLLGMLLINLAFAGTRNKRPASQNEAIH